MKIKNFLNPDSPYMDRKLRITSDDDLEDDSMVGMLNAGAGSQSGFSLEDEEQEEVIDDGETQEGNAGEDVSEKELKRIEDTQNAYHRSQEELSRIKSEREALQRELDSLKEAQSTQKREHDDSSIAERYTKELLSGVNGIGEDDPDRVDRVYEVIAKQQANIRREILNEIKEEQQRASKEGAELSKRQEKAMQSAEIAMQEVFEDSGLTYSKEAHRAMFQKEVDNITAQNPGWFDAIPGDQQFFRIAKKVASRVEQNKSKSREHLKSAGGYLKSGSKNDKRSTTEKDDSDKPDTLVEALGIHKRNLRRAGASRAKMVGRG